MPPQRPRIPLFFSSSSGDDDLSSSSNGNLRLVKNSTRYQWSNEIAPHYFEKYKTESDKNKNLYDVNAFTEDQLQKVCDTMQSLINKKYYTMILDDCEKILRAELPKNNLPKKAIRL